MNYKDNIESKNQIEGISKSQSKHIEVEEYKKRLDGEEYKRECNIYNLRSIKHEMHLQEIKNQHYLFSMINDVI